MSRRLAAKFLGFDALKGLSEGLSECENDYIDPITLGDDERHNMDLILLRCYRERRPIEIKQYKRGRIINYSGFIERIDMISHEIVITGRKRIALESIISLTSE